MRNLADRITKLEAGRGPAARRRIVRHVLDCVPSDRPARLAAIGATDPGAFHIVRVVVRPSERTAA